MNENIKDIDNLFNDCEKKTEESKTDYISFLKAIKPFLETNDQSKVENVIEVINKANALNNIIEDISDSKIKNDIFYEKEDELIVSSEGVYEIDSRCLGRNKKKNLSVDELALCIMFLM